MVWNILTIIIPAGVTVFGLLLNNRSMKKSFANELEKQRIQMNLEKMVTVPEEVLKLWEKLRKNPQSGIDRDFEKLYNKIFAYGSKSAVDIIADMQQSIYMGEQKFKDKDVNNEERTQWNLKILAHLVLLVVQTKYDTTGILINPSSWYKLRITDYEETQSKFNPLSNEIVKNIGLKSDFLIP